jgi:hypothetical protein
LVEQRTHKPRVPRSIRGTATKSQFDCLSGLFGSFGFFGSSNHTNYTNERDQRNQMLRSLFATATGKHLLLLGDTAAAITEFDGCVGHPIDAGYSSRDHRPAVGTGAGDWIVCPTILSQHGVVFLCSGERADYRQPT